MTPGHAAAGHGRRGAAIDIGTNSVRLIVAEVDGPDGYRVLDEEREQTRLGHRLHDTGRIDPEATRRTLEALERMRAIAESFEIDELRVVGTAALREADNGPDFVRAAREHAGIDVEVISHEEEAELAVRSVRKRFGLGPCGTVIVDIGGGSMEVVFATDGHTERVHSMPLGAVRLTELYVHSDPISPADWSELRSGIDRVLNETIGTAEFPTSELIGSGGTFTAVASMAMYDHEGVSGPVQGYAMTDAELERQLRRLKEAPLEVRRGFDGLRADRADIILAGVAVVARLAKRLDVRRIRINDGGVRDGMLLDMIDRIAFASA